jgi:hypothetical protein
MEDREEQLKSFEREDFIISNQVVNTPEETARCIKIMEDVMAKRKAQHITSGKKNSAPLIVKKRTNAGIRRTR